VWRQELKLRLGLGYFRAENLAKCIMTAVARTLPLAVAQQ
jgi:hypothetical protein